MLTAVPLQNLVVISQRLSFTVGRLGSVVAIPFVMVTSRSRFSPARGARRVVPCPLCWRGATARGAERPLCIA
jgi:hypothetical protein